MEKKKKKTDQGLSARRVFPEGRLSFSDQRERWRLTDQTREPSQEDLGDSSLLAQVPIITSARAQSAHTTRRSGECRKGAFFYFLRKRERDPGGFKDL